MNSFWEKVFYVLCFILFVLIINFLKQIKKQRIQEHVEYLISSVDASWFSNKIIDYRSEVNIPKEGLDIFMDIVRLMRVEYAQDFVLNKLYTTKVLAKLSDGDYCMLILYNKIDNLFLEGCYIVNKEHIELLNYIESPTTYTTVYSFTDNGMLLRNVFYAIALYCEDHNIIKYKVSDHIKEGIQNNRYETIHYRM